jgi:hypothetical protein
MGFEMVGGRASGLAVAVYPFDRQRNGQQSLEKRLNAVGDRVFPRVYRAVKVMKAPAVRSRGVPPPSAMTCRAMSASWIAIPPT